MVEPPDYKMLRDLPTEHSLRNRPLIQIHAERKVPGGTKWLPIAPNYKIARNTYNELGIAWTENTLWRAFE